MSVSQTKLIEISEQSLNWIFQKGMRFILILFQQFKYRPFLGWTWLKPSNRIFRDVFQRLAMIKAQFLIMGPLQSEIRLKITSQVRPILISRKIMIFGLMLRMGTAFILLTVQPFRLTRYSVWAWLKPSNRISMVRSAKTFRTMPSSAKQSRTLIAKVLL